MWYYIIENGRCLAIAPTIEKADEWLIAYKKKIKRISKFGDMVKVEVF